MDVAGKVAIITGGGSGLGAATARALAAKGAKVALLDINVEGAQAVAAETGGIAIECDVTSATSGEAAVAEAVEKLGTPHILVNAAGIAPGGRIVNKDGSPIALEKFEQGIKINLIGSFNIMRLAAAEMAKGEPVNDDGERGLVINTGSIASSEGQFGQAAYSASKNGVIGMMLPAAREFAKLGIRVNTINPGLFATPMLLSMRQDIQDNLASQVPFPKRFGTPEEYASLVIAIAENPMLNAETFRLDGAMRMQ
ncbi:MAG: SDR family NAD(P)-dependent oxidoreductase [Alphaproteobacteria bacterium]